MRYAVFSDIHANLEALEAVYADMDRRGVDEYICLGDLVGYGASPGPVMERVMDRTSRIVAGNHDYAICGKLRLDPFNTYARQAAEWTMDQLDDEWIDTLDQLPLMTSVDNVTCVHATFIAPERFDYILTAYDAELNFEGIGARIGFIGHSHIPVNFVMRDRLLHNEHRTLELQPGDRALVNVGSVGQPRDDDPRASYGVYDTEEESVRIHRVTYDIDTAANKIYEAGLPTLLGERLYRGK